MRSKMPVVLGIIFGLIGTLVIVAMSANNDLPVRGQPEETVFSVAVPILALGLGWLLGKLFGRKKA